MIWDIDRDIVTLGAFTVRWYSVMFALGIFLGYYALRAMFRAEGRPTSLLDGLLFYAVIGTIVGARLGHCLFYEPQIYLSDPLRILRVWEGGLASHGGFAGVIVALLLFCRSRSDVSFFWLADRMTMPAMLAAGCIRIGNFFNAEILGDPSSVPWAVVFKQVDLVPRHPAQLYEAAGYLTVGAVLYAWYRLKQRQPTEGSLFGLALVLAFSFRLLIEQLKLSQVSFEEVLPLNMGQLLSLPFILFGLVLLAGWHFKVAWLQAGLSPSAHGGALLGDLTEAPAGGFLPMPAPKRGQLRRMTKRRSKKP